MRVNDTPDLAADIALPSGILVQGRVLDKASRKPVPDVRVSVKVLEQIGSPAAPIDC